MIYPFAIEPEIVAGWSDPRDFRFFIRSFGLGEPRILAELPRFAKWRSRVLRQARELGLTGLALERVLELVKKIGNTRIARSTASFDGQRSWLQNALAEHRRDPFHAILAFSDDCSEERVITTQCLGNGDHPHWDLARSAFPERRAEPMTCCVAPLLKSARELLFVDPYFRLNQARWTRPLRAFLAMAWEGASCPKPERVELNASADYQNAPNDKHFQQECEKNLPRLLPPGAQVTVNRWKQRPRGEQFHDRHILSDLGGVSFGAGLDEGRPGETVRVTLMDREEYRKVWMSFSGSQVFQLESTFVVNSAGTL